MAAPQLTPLDQEEWEVLVGRPEWRKFRKYLQDYRQRTMEEWAAGQFQVDNRAERDTVTTDACARCQIYSDLATLEFKDIAEFYFTDEDSYTEETDDDE